MIELVGSHSGLDEMNYNTSKIINSNNDLNLILHTSSFNGKKMLSLKIHLGVYLRTNSNHHLF